MYFVSAHLWYYGRGVCVYHRNRVLQSPVFLKNKQVTNSSGPLRTAIQTPLWAKYWSLVARTGPLPWGSPPKSPAQLHARSRASVLGHFAAASPDRTGSF